jgi:hypothetical protein
VILLALLVPALMMILLFAVAAFEDLLFPPQSVMDDVDQTDNPASPTLGSPPDQS